MMDSTNLDNFEIIEKIGEGNFGQVFKVKEKSTGNIYAAKISFQALEDESHETIRNLSREINIISRLCHPSVLKFIGFSPINFKKKPKPVIITELSPNGSLRDIINLEKKGLSKEKWTDTHKLINIYGIASAMDYLHSHNIIHRDLKPENILMDELLLPKVADFGLSKIKHANEASMTSQSTINYKGTPIYTAPEIWTKYEYSKSSDVYAFAFIVYEIYAVQDPFEKIDCFQLMMNVLNDVRPDIPSFLPESYQRLIKSCWDRDPTKRPTFAKILYDLKNDPGFITDSIESADYLDFIDYLDSVDISFGPGKIISFDKYIKRESKTLNPESIDHELFSKDIKRDQIQIEIKADTKKLPFEKPEDDPAVATSRNFLYTSLDIIPDEKIPELIYLYATIMEGGEMFGKNHNEALLFCKIAVDLGYPDANLLYATLLSDSPENAELVDQYMTIAINQGSTEAMCQYATMLEEGKTVPQNLEKAFNLYKMAAEKGKEHSYNQVGLMYQFGRGTEVNYEEAMKCFQIAIEQGDSLAYPNIATLYIKGQGVPKDVEKAKEYLMIGIEKGCNVAINNYAVLCHELHDYEEAIKYFKQAAKLGNPEFYLNVGLYYLKGYGVPIDVNKAIKYYKKAASKGCKEAIFNLGLMNHQGKGIPVNYELALQYYQQGAALGDTNCIHNIAIMYNDGLGVEANKEESFKYYKMAADLGSVVDCAKTGGNYHYGFGTKIDLIQAERYYKIAIEKGNSEAMFLYSLILEKGAEGIPQNIQESRRLLKQAADNGLSVAIQYYNELLRASEEKKTGVNYEEALNAYKRSVDNGNLEAVNDILDLYISEKVPFNDRDAFKYAKIGADNGNTKAMLFVSTLYKLGKGTPVNNEEHLKYVKMAADLGNAEAMMAYGIVLDAGEIIAPDYDEALRYLKTAYESDCKVSIEIIFLMIMKGHIKQEKIEEIINYIRIAAVQNEEKHALATYATLLASKYIRVEHQDEETAKYLKLAADKGHVKAISSYAILLRDGIGVEKNYKEAMIYFKKFNESNDPQAMEFIGDMIINKQVDESEIEGTVNYLVNAAQNGNSYAIWKLGEIYLKGEIVPPNIDLGVQLIKKSADLGNLGAIKKYSTMLVKGEYVPRNEEEAKKYLQKYEGDDKVQLMKSLGLFEQNNEIRQLAIDSFPNIEQEINNFLQGKQINEQLLLNTLITMANKGFMPAIKGLALVYDNAGNIQESTRYHKIAADRGDPDSMYIIGKRLCTGNGILINYKLSCDYFKRSADSGNKIAANAYGIMLYHGLGTKVDKKQAHFYYKMAADQGLASAFNNIGVMAFKGEFINQDYDLANRMFKASADAKCTIAIYNYAYMAQNGFGFPQINNELAAYYYKLAADMGDVNAMKTYADLLDNADKSEATKYRQMASYQNKISDTINYQSKYFAVYVNKVDHDYFNDIGVDEANNRCVCSIC